MFGRGERRGQAGLESVRVFRSRWRCGCEGTGTKRGGGGGADVTALPPCKTKPMAGSPPKLGVVDEEESHEEARGAGRGWDECNGLDCTLADEPRPSSHSKMSDIVNQ